MKKIISLSQLFKSLLVITVFVAGLLCGLYHQTISYSFQRMFGKPTVSVIMSTYNRDTALPNAIESILNQTFDDFEFIIVNDGSTDNTDAQIRYYADKDPRIVYLKNDENKGLIYSLNRALQVARGKYIARMDDDDKSLPFRLERQVLAMDIYPQMTVLGGGIVGEQSKISRPIGVPKINNPDEMELNSYFSSALAHPTIIIRKEFLDQHNIKYDMNYTYAEDCGLYKDILNKGGRISAIQEPVLYFGYVKNLEKPRQYSYIQGETFKKIQKEKLDAFFDAPYEMLGAFVGDDIRCEILKKMEPANKTKKIINEKVLTSRIDSICKPFKASIIVSVTHPYWKDKFGIDEQRKSFYRFGDDKETGIIESEDDTTVTVSWDNWGKEIYTKETPEKWVYLKDDNGVTKTTIK